MTKKLGLTGGLLAFVIMLALPAPTGMAPDAWHMAA